MKPGEDKDSDTTEGWSHPHSTQGVDPGSAASPLPPVPGTLQTHSPGHHCHWYQEHHARGPGTLLSPVSGTPHTRSPGHSTCRAPNTTSTVPQKTVWTRQVTDSEDVPVVPPDSAQSGNLDPKTEALQQTTQSHPQLSQGSHMLTLEAGITHRLHTSEGAGSNSVLSRSKSSPVQWAQALAKCCPQMLE